MSDTIAALSTPPGAGFTGVLRVSGSSTWQVVTPVVAAGMPPARPRRRRGFDVRLSVDAEGRTCPACLWLLPGPRTYTGEDMAELHLWGAPALLGQVLERLCAAGARPAEPGEFTRRAFLNGKTDLARAEAVLELIHARSDQAHRLALRQRAGSLSRTAAASLDGLTELASLVEAALDFSDQDIEVVSREEVRAGIGRARAGIEELARRSIAAETCDALPVVVLTGRTGAGKSSLFNRMVTGARAIVSGIPGTTRDALSGVAELPAGAAGDGGPRRIRLVDTAGYRAAGDAVEREAIARLDGVREEAALVVVVVDREEGLQADDRRVLASLAPERVLRVWSKADRAPAGHAAPAGWRDVSARSGAGLDGLAEAIACALGAGPAGDAGADYLLNARQRDVLRRAGAALDRAAAALDADLGLEFVAYDLRGALGAFGEILGRVTPEDLLDRIFARFCIGK